MANFTRLFLTFIAVVLLSSKAMSQCAGTYTITISPCGYWDEGYFQIRNATNAVVYGSTYGSGTFTYVADGVAPNNGPFTIFLSTVGFYNDNCANYTVEAYGQVLYSGSITGGQNFQSTSFCAFGPTLVSQTNVACNGGSTGAIDISVSGGTPGYTYLWSNGATTQDISGLSAGNYSVTVTDNLGTTSSGNYTITEPVAIDVSFVSSSNVSCWGDADGSIDLLTTTCNNPVTYLWSDGTTSEDLTNVVAGSYSVTATDNLGNSVNLGPFVISQPDYTSSLAVTDVVSGNDGAIDLTVNSSQLVSMQYVWLATSCSGPQNLSFLVNGANVYNGQADAGTCSCTPGINSTTITTQALLDNVVNGPNNFVADFTGVDNQTWAKVILTFDDASTQEVIIFDISGGAASNNGDLCLGMVNYTYQSSVQNVTLSSPSFLWSNGATTEDLSGLSAGIYTVDITIGSCVYQETATVLSSCTGPSFLTCPTNISLNNVPTNCGRVVNYPLPTFNPGDCGGATMVQTDGTGLTRGDLFPVGTTTQTYTVTDINGNTATCTFDVTVSDNELPIITSCPSNITVNTTPGQCSKVVSWAQPTASDNCPGVFMAPVPQGPGSTFALGVTTIIYTAVDASANSSTCSFTVTVNDNESPVITACTPDVLVSNDPGDCGAIVTFAAPTYTENCTMGTEVASQASGTFFPIGTTPVTWTLTDNAGNTSTCEFDVTVEDNELPVAVCTDITVQLDAAGSYAMLDGEIDGGSTDNCPIASITASQLAFDCTHVGANTIVLTVEDIHGNSSTCNAIVTVEDNVAPVAMCQDITVQLDASGAATITGANIDNGSSDACGIASLTSDVTSFNCTNVGGNTVILTVEDNNGNTTTCTSTVTVEDNVAPVAICQDITAQLDATGNVTITTVQVDNGSNDACGVASLALDIEDFTCANVGANTVVLTVTDNNGNTSTCSSTVTVEDNVAPNAVCQDITVQLNAAGSYTMVASEIDGGSTDACGIASIAASKLNFDCSSVGPVTVTLTVTDNNGNTSSCDATVTVEDNVAPVAICQDITAQLDAMGDVTITPAQVDNGSSDACGIASLALDVTSFDCSNVGANTVILTVEDNNGNTTTCTSTVTVEDNVAPVAICQAVTVQLDAAGVGSITTGDIDNGSNDACGIALLALDIMNFTCAEVGANTVVLTVTDNNGNSTTCSSVVTVEDNVAPVAICQAVTVQLDAAGLGSITTGDIDNGSNDACGIASLALDVTDFTCAEVGANTVILTVTDNNGNSTTCSSVVTVEDNVDPVAICQDITAQLDASGNVTITSAQVDNGSNDACGIASLVLDVTDFTCANVGANTVILTVTDNNGNTSTCSSTVTVEDNVAPAVVCQDITVQLDGTGNIAITGADIDGGSSDACLIVSTVATPSAFTCAEVGPNNVTLTVTDSNGNSSTCVAIVTVEETTPPVALCQDITVQLDAAGNASITGMDIDGGSTDNCAIVTWDASPNTFTCAEVGGNTVILTVTDGSGNSTTCSSTVTVEDNVAPVAICQDITVQLDAAGMASITTGDIDNGSNDACGIASLALDVMDFTCANVGTNTVVLTVTDNNGNTSTCSSTVTVEDNIAPIAICQDITVQLDAAGNALLVGADIDNGSNDACGIASLTSDVASFDCSNIGANAVILTVEDNNGNTSTCTSTVTVEDNVDPTAICQDITVQLDASGMASITTGDIDNGSNDACGIASLVLDITSFDCTNVGPNTVILTVEDNNGNTSTCSSTVTVEDNIVPVAFCQNITVQLDASGNASITGADIDGGSSDACGIASLTTDISTFDCSNVGSNAVVLTVTDNNGNTATCMAAVTVEDNVAPTAVCQDIIVSLDASGNAVITATDIDGGSSDACGIASISASQTMFDCSDLPVIDPAQSLIITGVVDGPLPGGIPKAIELYAKDNIADLSLYGIGSANNGGGTDGEEYTFSGSASAGQYIYVASESIEFTNFFGFAPDFTTGAAAINGDDAIELFYTGGVVDVFGDINLDGTGTPWDYLDGWVYRNSTSGPDGSTFVLGNWTYSGINALDGETTNATAAMPFPVATYVAQPAGVVTVVLTVTDNNGNSSTCSANVTVEDNIAPAAVCQDITVQLDASGNASITGMDIDGGSSDNCSITNIDATPNTFTCAEVGANTVTLTVTDVFGNTSTCESTVTVEDNVAPVAVCQDITVQLDAAGLVSITAMDVDNGSNDACGIASTTIDVMDFDCSNVGLNTVILTVTDNNGNATTCSSTVTVEDNIAPVAVCQDITVQLDGSGLISILASDIDNGSNDACGIGSLTADVVNFDCSNVGPNTVILTVTDNNGNTSTCTSTVTVEDVELPTITCPADIIVSTDPGVCGSGVVLNSPVTNDNCGVASVMNDAPALFPVGATNVTWTVTDDNGNTAECIQIVMVEDNEFPMITCPADITVDTDPTSCDAVIVLNSPVVTDNCSALVSNDAPAVFLLGTTTVTWSAVDPSGNVSTCIQMVTVEDNELPTITCPVDVTVSTDPGVCVAGNVVLGSPVTGDNCGVATISNNAPQFFQLGTTTVTWTVVDNSGNVTTCAQVVTVEDNELPYVQCPIDITQNIVTGSCGRVVHYPTPIALDNCSPVVMTQVDGTGYSSGSVFPVGTTVQTYEGVDGSGNVFTCSFNVTIVDNQYPTLSNCPSNKVAYSTASTCDVPVFWATPFASDNCPGTTLTSNHANGSNFPVGTTTVVYTAGDQSGNLVSCSFTVTVIDTVNPIGPASMPDVVSSCEVTLTPPTATDNCAGTITATTTTSFPITTVGITGVVWSFNDGNGNFSSVVQYVDIDGAVNTTVSILDDITLQANNTAPGVTYQWVACPFNEPVPGATDQTFMATINGSYAVIVTEGDCPPATSFCYTINNVSLEDIIADNMVVFPNPSTNGIFNITYEGQIEKVEVIDVIGRIITVPMAYDNKYINASELASGKYMLRIYTEGSVVNKEVIITNK